MVDKIESAPTAGLPRSRQAAENAYLEHRAHIELEFTDRLDSWRKDLWQQDVTRVIADLDRQSRYSFTDLQNEVFGFYLKNELKSFALLLIYRGGTSLQMIAHLRAHLAVIFHEIGPRIRKELAVVGVPDELRELEWLILTEEDRSEILTPYNEFFYSFWVDLERADDLWTYLSGESALIRGGQWPVLRPWLVFDSWAAIPERDPEEQGDAVLAVVDDVDQSNIVRVERLLNASSAIAGRKITKKEFREAAGYTDATTLLQFQRDDPRTSAASRVNFERVLRMSPGEFAAKVGKS